MEKKPQSKGRNTENTNQLTSRDKTKGRVTET